MRLAMAKGFNELSQNEMMEVDGGFGIIATAVAWVLLGVAASPAIVSVGVIANEAVTAIDNSLDADRERGRRDGIIQAREDYENGFTDSFYK